MRPRIRTIKPEMWAHERIGRLTRDARLFWTVLITMADDEGRLRALPAGILGHGYPYGDATGKEIEQWLGEVAAVGLIDLYEHDEVPYVAVRGWARHQKINRPTASCLPAPPNPPNERERAVEHHGGLTEGSVRAREAVTEHSRQDQDQEQDQDQDQDLSSSSSVPDDDPEIAGLSHLLAQQIRERDPQAKVAPDSKRWLDPIRLLRDRDRRSGEEIERILLWLAEGKSDDAEFWRGVVLCPSKLRKQFHHSRRQVCPADERRLGSERQGVCPATAPLGRTARPPGRCRLRRHRRRDHRHRDRGGRGMTAWTDALWDAFAGLVEEGWPGEFSDEAAGAWRILLDGLSPEQATEGLRRLLYEGHRFRPSASELMAASRRDPSKPTFGEAYQLIFGPRGVLHAQATMTRWSTEGERRRLQDAAAAECAAEMHPFIGGFVRAQGLDYLRNLPVDDPEWGRKHRADLERAYAAFVKSHDGREVAALAAGTGHEGLRRLDPLAALGHASRELPAGDKEET